MKIKDSIRKKLLTTLLLGVTLGTTMTGIGASKSFAYSSVSSNIGAGKVASKELSQKIIKQMEEESKSKSRSVINLNGMKRYRFFEPRCDLYWTGQNLYGLDYYGQSLVGTWTIGDMTLNFDYNNGKAFKEGWKKISDTNGHNGRYYFRGYQAVKDGLKCLDDGDYLFDKFGVDLTGRQTYRGYTYLFGSDGKRQYGYVSDRNGNIAYYRPKDGGAMVKGFNCDDPAGVMYFMDNGYMAPYGIMKITTNLGNHRAGLYNFQHHGRGKYTYLAYGFWSEGNDRYYFDENDGHGYVSEWLGTNKRTSNSNGSMYFDEQGHMAKGVTKIGNETYLFQKQGKRDANYYETYGWFTDKSTNKRYYFNDGVSARSASNSRATTPVGAAVKGTQVINGKTYQFDNNGVLIK